MREEAGKGLVRDRALAGATRARDPDHGHARATLGPVHLEEREVRCADRPVLEGGEHLGHGEIVAGCEHVGHARHALCSA